MTEASNRSAGFTLLELMAAMGIFVFGLTALIGVLTIGVGTRRGAEMRTRAVLLADRVLHRIETETLVTAASLIRIGAGCPGTSAVVITTSEPAMRLPSSACCF